MTDQHIRWNNASRLVPRGLLQDNVVYPPFPARDCDEAEEVAHVARKPQSEAIGLYLLVAAGTAISAAFATVAYIVGRVIILSVWGIFP